jgi:putative Holliday junction resolvase
MPKILGIDYGLVRIGIALSDETGTIAFGREAIASNNPVDKLKKIISDENVNIVVIGYPLNLKGEKTKQTLEVESFEAKIKAELSSPPFNEIKITRWDERFTSKMASDSMLESGMKKKKRRDKSNLDIISAAIMLQSYLDSVKANTKS